MNNHGVDFIRSSKVVRERSRLLYDYVLSGESQYWKINQDKLAECAKLVFDVTKESYPDFKVPYHSRWRHFEVDGVDLWQAYSKKYSDNMEKGGAAYALAIVSVLLDAGAGMGWKYIRDGKEYSKSEGLALASFDWFTTQTRMTASCLKSLTVSDLEKVFQATTDNPVVGLEGRLSLLHSLGAVIEANKDVFKTSSLEDIFTYVFEKVENKKIEAEDVLKVILNVFSDVWPSRTVLEGENLGDVWKHPALERCDPMPGYIPFHKLSQWLTYSLFEPLEELGIEVKNLDHMTGLPEYRNGGLFMDSGLLEMKNDFSAKGLKPDDLEIIEWRALTVTLLDELASFMRKQYAECRDWPLAKFLQGGSWTAGRRLAKNLRTDGGPPLNIVSDGTVF